MAHQTCLIFRVLDEVVGLSTNDFLDLLLLLLLLVGDLLLLLLLLLKTYPSYPSSSAIYNDIELKFSAHAQSLFTTYSTYLWPEKYYAHTFTGQRNFFKMSFLTTSADILSIVAVSYHYHAFHPFFRHLATSVS